MSTVPFDTLKLATDPARKSAWHARSSRRDLTKAFAFGEAFAERIAPREDISSLRRDIHEEISNFRHAAKDICDLKHDIANGMFVVAKEVIPGLTKPIHG